MGTKKDAATLTTASVLAFERKLDPSDGLFYAGLWSDRQQPQSWAPVHVVEKSVRGTISNRLKTKDQDPAKLDALIGNPNLQKVDVASLPAAADTLKVTFTLRILGGAGMPSACNHADYKLKLIQTVESYTTEHGFGALALRYAYNVANGRFLWRNRVGAESVEVHIAHLVNGVASDTWVFDGLSLPLRDFAQAESNSDLQAVADLVANGLSGKTHVLLQITAFVRQGFGQEVFPSQELILDRGRGDKSKTLYQVHGIAGLHSQKIGNALRTIDTWYPDANSLNLGPIAIEPYGSVTTEGRAYRRPQQKVDFYNLLDNWVLRGQKPSNAGNQHFVMANLVRGGVFGDSGKD